MKKLFTFLTLLALIVSLSPATVTHANEPVLIFELTEDEVDSYLACIADETTDWNSPGGGHKYLRPAAAGGRPVYGKSPGGGISMMNRTQDWHSIDIRHEWMDEGKAYRIVVEFESSEDTHFTITNTDAPYGAMLAVTDSVSTGATLEYEMGFENSAANGQRGVRLTTYPQSSVVDYTIAAIRIFESDAAPRLTPKWQLDIPSLYQTYADYFPIGNVMDPGQTENGEMTAMYLHHYNTVTAENAMKPAGIAPNKGVYNFDGPEQLISWAEANNVEVHGHTLVWHAQSAPWLTTGEGGEPLTRLDAKANMEEFITTYVGHFAGRVMSWDVVNEAFTDGVSGAGEWYEKLRTNSPWYKAYANGMNEAKGEAPHDYIYDAFVFARLADPNALLFYNDFNEESIGKRFAIAEMVEALNERWLSDERNDDPDRLLVEVIGMQAHYWTSNLKPSDVRSSIERFVETGAKVAVTELDIPTGSYGSFKGDNEEHLQKQAELYEELFKIYMDNAENIVRVTFWGKADIHSWRGEGHPLLFDRQLQAKEAYWRIIQLILPDAMPPETPAPEPEVTQPEAEPEPATPKPLPTLPSPTPDTPDKERSSATVPLAAVYTAGGIFVLAAIALIIVLITRKKKG